MWLFETEEVLHMRAARSILAQRDVKRDVGTQQARPMLSEKAPAPSFSAGASPKAYLAYPTIGSRQQQQGVLHRDH
jgi:hypothetical protein